MSYSNVESELPFLFKQVVRGRSIARAYFNNAMRSVQVYGDVADIGAGPKPYYHDYMQQAEGTTFHNVDRQLGDTTNFETDTLPLADNSYDVVLSMNVLEHIYNHQFHFSELIRIVKPGGKIVLFVPFLHMYHPNPKIGLMDFFRYTGESLARLSQANQLTNTTVTPVSRASTIAALHMINLSLPRFIRPVLFCISYWIDGVILRMRPHRRNLYPLGYILEAKKPESKSVD